MGDASSHIEDEDAILEAKKTLSRAIAAYYDTVAPGSYVDGWLLGTRRVPSSGEYAGQSIVSTSVSPDQDWVLTRGIGETVIDAIRAGSVG
jgi:hypothetical protein